MLSRDSKILGLCIDLPKVPQRSSQETKAADKKCSRFFDQAGGVEDHCVQLEHDVHQAAESAVKHIHEIEKDLLKQIQDYRQGCLDALTAQSSESSSKDDQSASQNSQSGDSLTEEPEVDLKTLTKEIEEFSTKWNEYFKRLNSLASDSEIEAAIPQTDELKARIKTLEQETRNNALLESTVLFTSGTVFHSSRDHLGELVRISTPLKHANESKFLLSLC